MGKPPPPKAHSNKGSQTTGGPEYHNPDPLVSLTGKQNIEEVQVNSITCDGLSDGGSQMTITTERLKTWPRASTAPLREYFEH